ncbi:FUSC family protein [Clostridium ganghwense]|uniref:FUSC family protein n=1 Tax=Clostridium ganghwense TaxID=312089 RepID=A0ABT4CSL9_9CLOT|nr:FUSC family protein [Clostridium ganghwense]MCY6371056.1 FUSC family protein [Clostridium ganghwense]
MNSLSFNLAIKETILLAIVYFFINYFKIPNGMWLLGTILATYAPFSEHSIEKTKRKIIGTIGGFLLSSLVFLCVNSNIVIIILVLISLYFIIYISAYDIRAIFITFSAISAAGISQIVINIYVLGFDRVGFILISSILVYIAMKWIYPFSFKNAIKDLIINYKLLNNDILDALDIEKGIDYDEVFKLNLINKYLWRKGNYLDNYLLAFTKNKQISSDIEEKLIKEILYIEGSLIDDLIHFYIGDKEIREKVLSNINEKIIRIDKLSLEII